MRFRDCSTPPMFCGLDACPTFELFRVQQKLRCHSGLEKNGEAYLQRCLSVCSVPLCDPCPTPGRISDDHQLAGSLLVWHFRNRFIESVCQQGKRLCHSTLIAGAPFEVCPFKMTSFILYLSSPIRAHRGWLSYVLCLLSLVEFRRDLLRRAEYHCFHCC